MSIDSEEINNDFNSWDCFGATFMLGITPAVLNFVFNDKDIVSTVALAGLGLLVSLVVFLLALFTRSRAVGVIVNGAGYVLTVGYVVFAVIMWWPSPEEVPADAAAESAAVPAEN